MMTSVHFDVVLIITRELCRGQDKEKSIKSRCLWIFGRVLENPRVPSSIPGRGTIFLLHQHSFIHFKLLLNKPKFCCFNICVGCVRQRNEFKALARLRCSIAHHPCGSSLRDHPSDVQNLLMTNLSGSGSYFSSIFSISYQLSEQRCHHQLSK